jgi:N-acetylglutamate synthase-like GNAT family acetyltransferase
MKPALITIRRAVESDLQSAVVLLEALGYPNLEQHAFTSTFARVLQHPDMMVLLAIDESEQVVGLMSLSHRPQLRLAGEILSIDELTVLNTARSQGMGQRLLEEARRLAKEISAKRIELHTNRNRESYRRQFYLKNGFTEVNSALMRLECE